MNEFPEFMEPEIPQGAAGLIEVMKRIHEQPDSRAFEWRVVFAESRLPEPTHFAPTGLRSCPAFAAPFSAREIK